MKEFYVYHSCEDNSGHLEGGRKLYPVAFITYAVYTAKMQPR